MDAKLKALFIQHLGKTARRYWRDAACDIIAVHQGIKPGFLYDYGTITPNCLSSLTFDVIQTVFNTQRRGEGSNLDAGSMSELCIISLGQDVILTNTALMLRRLEEHQKTMRLGFSNIVDISQNLKSPKILSLSSSSGAQLREDFDHLYIQYKQKMRTGLLEDKITQIEVDNAEDFNLSTAFGLLIGYPVLYWYEGGPQASNCLNMVPLAVYQVACDITITAQKTTCTSPIQELKELKAIGGKNSVASASCVETSRDCSNENTDKDLLKSGHILYSFSVPECVVTNFDGLIASWFDNLQVTGSSALIQRLNLIKKTVSLPSVIL